MGISGLQLHSKLRITESPCVGESSDAARWGLRLQRLHAATRGILPWLTSLLLTNGDNEVQLQLLHRCISRYTN